MKKYFYNVSSGGTKKEGNINIVILSIFIVAIVISLIFFMMYRRVLDTGLNKLKLGSDMANLSVYKDISKSILGTYGSLEFNESDLNNAFNTFKEYLSENLGVDEQLKPIPSNKFLVDGLVIEKMIIYSVKNDGSKTVYSYNNNAAVFQCLNKDTKNEIKTPYGKTVEKTSVFTQVRFTIKLPFAKNYSNIITSYTDIVN